MRNTKPNCLCLIALGFAVRFTVSACSEKVAPEIPKIEEGEAAAIVNGEKVYVSDVELEAVARGSAPADGLAPSCAEAGVIGPLPGVVGAMMAQEAIKLITGAGAVLRGEMLIYDGLYGETRKMTLKPRADCPICAK